MEQAGNLFQVTDVIPVWLATWELDCCHADFAVGDSWETTLVSYDHVEPSADTGETFSAVELGMVRFTGSVERAARSEHELALVRIGSFRIGVRGLRHVGTVSGTVQLHFEGHGPWMGVEPEEVRVAGRVRRIERVAIVYREVRPRMFEIAGYRDPVDVATTRERREHDALLITLEPQLTQSGYLGDLTHSVRPRRRREGLGQESGAARDDAECFLAGPG